MLPTDATLILMNFHTAIAVVSAGASPKPGQWRRVRLIVLNVSF